MGLRGLRRKRTWYMWLVQVRYWIGNQYLGRNVASGNKQENDMKRMLITLVAVYLMAIYAFIDYKSVSYVMTDVGLEIASYPKVEFKLDVPVMGVSKPTVALQKKVVQKKVSKYNLHVDGERLFDYLETAENPDGDPELIGDKHLKHRAYGLLQIRQPCLSDVSKFSRKAMLKKYGRMLTIRDMKDREKARWVAAEYLHYYGEVYEKTTGHIPTMKVYARIHNGGPSGWRRGNIDTLRYWARVVRVNGIEGVV